MLALWLMLSNFSPFLTKLQGLLPLVILSNFSTFFIKLQGLALVILSSFSTFLAKYQGSLVRFYQKFAVEPRLHSSHSWVYQQNEWHKDSNYSDTCALSRNNVLQKMTMVKGRPMHRSSQSDWLFHFFFFFFFF